MSWNGDDPRSGAAPSSQSIRIRGLHRAKCHKRLVSSPCPTGLQRGICLRPVKTLDAIEDLCFQSGPYHDASLTRYCTAIPGPFGPFAALRQRYVPSQGYPRCTRTFKTVSHHPKRTSCDSVRRAVKSVRYMLIPDGVIASAPRHCRVNRVY